MEQYTGPDTMVYDLNGTMVFPGFIDTHIHQGGAARLRAGVDLSPCTSVTDMQEMNLTYAIDHPDEANIGGFGRNYFNFNESGPGKSMLNAIILDKIGEINFPPGLNTGKISAGVTVHLNGILSIHGNIITY